MLVTSRLRPSIFGVAVMLALALALAACAPSGAAASRSLTRTLPHAGGVASHRPSKGPPAPAAVTIDATSGFHFSPSTLTVVVGTTVTWTNTTISPHTVTSDTGGAPIPIASPVIQASGGSFSFTFLTLGTYHYHCSIHPFMKATIVVVAEG